MRFTIHSFLHMAVAATIVQAGVAARAHRISHLILDFDETLTTHDTIEGLATAAYSLRPQGYSSPNPPPWSFFTDSYMSDYTAHTSQLPPKETRTTVAAELEYLSSLLPVERASIERIEANGVFAGLKPADLSKAAATSVELRAGWFSHVVKPALASGTKVSILSVNWSTAWIIGALKAGALREGGDETCLDGVEVMANDLIVDAEGVTTGKMTRWFEDRNEGIWTAPGKKAVLDEYLGCQEREKKDLAVYVGDSATDLEAALAADVGVFIGEKQVELAQRIGIELVTVPRVDALLGRKSAAKPKLVKVDSMEELGKVLGFQGEY